MAKILNSKCRVCGNIFLKKPLLTYRNMPKSAQFLPDSKSLKSDKGVSLEIFQCSGCGVVQLNSAPVPYYKEVVRAVNISPGMTEFRLKQFSDFVKKFNLKNKKIIEIGCGKGEYLSIMKKCAKNVYGLEYSAKSAAFGKKNRLNVQKGFLENSNYKLKNAPFDAFYILSFLEHLPDPSSVLRGIFNNLTDGAIGLVEVPNFDMIFKNRLFSEFMTDHLFYFTKSTLRAMLESNGFEVIGCREVWRNYIISAIARKRKKIDVSHFYRQQEKVKKQIEKYINRFGNRKVAIWGAGHQALAVISLMGFGNKIKYVIDSAPFKQNKFTPATHIKIVAPSTIYKDPPDAIIIMAASYSDEVAKIILEKYNNGNIKVAALKNFGLLEIKNL